MDEEGNLWVTSEDGNAPNFQYDSATGNLYVVADGTNVLIGNVKGIQGERGADGTNGKDGSDGVSAKHSWNGTTLTITSASGTSSADLKGAKGDKGDTGAAGSDASVTTANITAALGYTPANEAHEHSAANITSGVLPMSRGGTGATDADTARANIGAAAAEHEHEQYLTEHQSLADYAKKTDIPTLSTESWTFTLEDGSTVSKSVYVG